jgi:hypothetical protein
MDFFIEKKKQVKDLQAVQVAQMKRIKNKQVKVQSKKLVLFKK